MESEGKEKSLGPVSSAAENLQVMVPSTDYLMEESNAMLKSSVPSCETPTLKKDEFHPNLEIYSDPKLRENMISAEHGNNQGLDIDAKNDGSLIQGKPLRVCSEPGSNSKAYLYGVEDINSRTIKLSCDAEKDDVTGLPPSHCFVEDADGDQNSKNKVLQSEIESRIDADGRTICLSPIAEIKDGKKHICDFFAKGWCIRDSSCTFLHIKDVVNNTDQDAEVALVDAHQKQGLKWEEGVKDNADTSRMNKEEASPSLHQSHENQKFLSRYNLFPEDRFVLNALSKFSSHSPEIKSNICSYDWEPSETFRPSFFLTKMNESIPGELYDPLCNKIEIPNIGDGSLKATILTQGNTIPSLTQGPASSQVPDVVGKNMSDLNEDKSYVSSPNRCYENEPNKSCVPSEKDCLATETAITLGTYENTQNGEIGMGQHTKIGVKDIMQPEKELIEHDIRHDGEGSSHKKRRVEVDKTIQVDIDSEMDESMQKEKVRIFRATLVELVKELLRPSWHEGRISKMAHVVIVKKSVDKIIDTLEPRQIPTTVDTAKQYVTSFRGRIAKMVSAYVTKYGKPT